MTSAARISSLLVCIAVLFCLGAGVAHAQLERPSGLHRLWSAYPVGSERAASTLATREKRRAAAADRSSSSSALTPVVLGFVSALAAAGLLAAFLVLRQRPALSGRGARTSGNRSSPRPEGPKMSDFKNRLFKTSDEQTHEARPPSAPAERAQSAEPAPVPARPREPDRDQASIEVGDQVATILASAKQAAQRLQVSARQDAERIRGEAKKEAAKLRGEAESYSTSTRKAADEYAAERRRTIDAELGKQRKDAERESNEIRAAAKQRAEKLSSEGIRRQRALVAETQRSEARLQQLLGVFRALTAQLEDLIGDERPTAPNEGGRSLEEALKPYSVEDRPVQPTRSGK